MNLNDVDKKKLESYLKELDYYLGSLPISEKSEIILEIKGHVLDSYEKSPHIESILENFGTPKETAKRYLSERGLSSGQVPRDHPTHHSKPHSRRVFKLVFGTIIFMFLVMTALSITALFKFTPIIKIDGEKGRVQILGGLIDINDSEANDDNDDNNKSSSSRGHSVSVNVSNIEKEYEVNHFQHLDLVKFKIGSGNLEIKPIQEKETPKISLHIKSQNTKNDFPCELTFKDDPKDSKFEVYENKNQNCHFDIVLELPALFAKENFELEFTSGSGDFKLDGIFDTNFNLKLNQGSGDVAITNATLKQNEIKNGSGDINLKNYFALKNDFKQGSGDIKIELSKEISLNMDGNIDIKQGSGDANIFLKKGSLVKLNQKSGFGKINTKGNNLIDTNAKFEISQKVGSGNLNIEEF